MRDDRYVDTDEKGEPVGKNNKGDVGDIINIENTINEELSGGDNEGGDCCRQYQKLTPRRQEDLKALKNRLSRMQGQLSGIGRMLDENRYCGDILIQVGAVESALHAFGHLILKEHMETCVQEKIRQGDTEVIAETLALIEKLK